MFRYHNHKLCITYNMLVENGPVKKTTYDQAKFRNSIVVYGAGAAERLIEYDTMPATWKRTIEAIHGDPYLQVQKDPIRRLVIEDMKARQFYAAYKLEDGRGLPVEAQQKYARQADWLRMMTTHGRDNATIKSLLNMNKDQFWKSVIELYSTEVNPCGLPGTYRRLLDRIKEYKDKGYAGLVDKRYQNQNSRKVDDKIENLILSIYCLPSKPYITDVVRLYGEFMQGQLQVVDMESAELLQPGDYLVNGEVYEVKESTVKYYLNKPVNKAVAGTKRMGGLERRSNLRPHHMRKAPMYAMSKITMDDTSSPFKMHNGDRPATYKAFDVASGALLGLVMHDRPRPNTDMIRRLMRDMVALIARNGWKMPAQVEVEHALMGELKGKKDKVTGAQLVTDVLTQGAVFGYVHFCAPSNPQEKRAEGFIKKFKYEYQKKREGFQMRPFAKLEANRANQDGASHKERFSYAEIYQMEMEDMADWNNSPHPDQETYPGLSRWQVLEQCQNPMLPQISLPAILPYVGHRTETSCARAFVQVKYRKYMLDNLVEVFPMLESDQLLAYYLLDENNAPEHVHLYDYSNNWICEAIEVVRYQEAKAEQTEEDIAIYQQQKAYIATWDKLVKGGKNGLMKVGFAKPEQQEAASGDGDTPVIMSTEMGANIPENESWEGGYEPKTGGKTAWWEDAAEVERRAGGEV